MKILLTCGPGLEPSENAYMIVVDWSTKEIVDRAEMKHDYYSESHKGFSGGALNGSHLLVTSETELFKYELNPLKLVARTSSELFNDVHHVCEHGGYYYVSNSGLDSIEVFDENFEHHTTIPLIRKYGFHTWHLKQLARDDFKRWIDRRRGSYRFFGHLNKRYFLKNLVKLINPNYFHKHAKDSRVLDLRPHVLHPNHCLSVNGELWVTLWRPGAIMNAFTGEIVVNNLGRPHDGYIFDNDLFVTDCKNNRIFSFHISDLNSKKIEKRLEKVVTNKIEEGFLRGCTARGDRAFLGLSARRNSPKWNFARVMEIDRSTGEFREDWRVPEKYGKSIYSVIDVTDIYEKKGDK